MVALALVLAGCGSTGGSSASQAAATSTPATTGTAAPSSSEEPRSGWQRVEIEDHGFAISLPRGWEVADLTSGDIDAMIEFLEGVPELEALADQLPSLIGSGIGLFAVSLDAAGIDAGFATNLNVLIQEDLGGSLDVYAAANASFIEETFAVDVARESVALPAGESVRLEYEPEVDPVGMYHVTQYALLHDGRGLVATFSRAVGDEFEALEPEFLEIMETIEFLP